MACTMTILPFLILSLNLCLGPRSASFGFSNKNLYKFMSSVCVCGGGVVTVYQSTQRPKTWIFSNPKTKLQVSHNMYPVFTSVVYPTSYIPLAFSKEQRSWSLSNYKRFIKFVISVFFVNKLDWSVYICLTQLYLMAEICIEFIT